MNVEEYFPEGLSVIHPDESHGEERKREKLSRFTAARHCHICYKSINGAINNVDFVKPCNCQLMFVHTACAKRKRAKFGEAKCSNCGQDSTISRTSKMTYPVKVASEPRGCSKNMGKCSVCHDEKEPEKGKKLLQGKIRPCFCRSVYHYGCFLSVLAEMQSCSECCVLYTAFEPASFKQFFKTKWIFYMCYLFVLSLLSTMFVMAFRNSTVFKKRSISLDVIDKELILTFTSIFFLFVIVTSIFCIVKYTVCSAIPEFRITHGKVILKAVEKENVVCSEKPSKKDLSTLMEEEYEDIPLVELGKPLSKVRENAVEEARGCETDDMTLGQHMFGVYATHHSSSTPIDKPPLGFVFNSG
uniref:RING-CH-type domain-containing protein n=1 Tax=Caenorhabditis japonica TaxID=281687 RepID=A0A8R1I280_CAEJA